MIRQRPREIGISRYYERWHQWWHRGFMIVESHFNRVFPEKHNPFYFLGALTIFTLLILVVTGIYMFIYYSPSVETVYESVKYVNEEAFLGSLTRSVHQYASDLMIVLVILHMVRVFVQDKYRKYRWIAWVSGVVMLFFTILEGVTGHIMAWNERSQFIVVQTSKLIAALKAFGEDLPRAFASEALLSTWIMWILLAIHILIPIAFIFLLYIHLSRISRARLLPTRPVMITTVVFLVGFSLLFPVRILEKADLMKIPQIEEVDWFYLFMTPFLETTNPYLIWIGTVGLFIFLACAPWYRRPLKIDVATRDLDNCTGCAACAKDCPYQAIFMRPRSDGKKFKMESVVIEDRCAGCGICVGSCAFNSMDLTKLNTKTLEQELDDLLAHMGPQQTPIYIGLFCQNSVTNSQVFDLVNHSLVDEPRLKILSLPCAGMVGPSFIKSAFKKGVEGILIAACRSHDCHYREGNLWLQDRLAGKRVPKVHLKDESKPVVALSFSSVESQNFIAQAKSLLDTWQGHSHKPNKRGLYQTITKGTKFESVFALIGVAALFLFLYTWGTLDPWKQVPEPLQNTGMLKVNYFHLSDVVSCDTTDLEEGTEKVRSQVNQMTRKDNVSAEGQEQAVSSNLVAAILCPRERVPVQLKIMLDGNLIVEKSFEPAGFSNDGLTYVEYETYIASGPYELEVNMVDSSAPGRQAGISFQSNIEVADNQILFIDFNEEAGEFYIRNNLKEDL